MIPEPALRRSTAARVQPAALTEPLAPGDELDLTLIELLFFAYRDFTADADQILERDGFGRAHHRVLHFVNRAPGLTVAELLDVLKITKQSLARVLKQLVDTGHVVQRPGPMDRRQRRLYPTPQGRDLLLALAVPQSRRIRAALRGGADRDRQAVEAFLRGMVETDGRHRLDSAGESAENGAGRARRGNGS